MENSYLICQKCHMRYPIQKESLCPKCGDILTVEYKDSYLKKADVALKKKTKISMWDYWEVLPLATNSHITTFQEGGTNLAASFSLGSKLGMSRLFLKDETKNPTGSFKDRSVSLCVSMAKQFGCPGVVVSSSGNGGAATAAYGKKAGIDTIIFVPESTPEGKVAQAIAYGGHVIKVAGHFSNAYRAAIEMAEEKGYMNVTTTFLSPYGLEGYKIIGYEIYEQMQTAPDIILIPVGAGPVLYGIYKGFDEMMRMGRIMKMPRLVCVQAEGCAPISKAFIEQRKVSGCENPHSIASAISDPLIGYEQDGDFTIEAIRKTNGCAITVKDEQIISAGRCLAQEEGVFAEPSSAAAVAGLIQLLEQGWIQQNDTCVCLITGHGLKDSSAYLPDNLKIPVIETIHDL